MTTTSNNGKKSYSPKIHNVRMANQYSYQPNAIYENPNLSWGAKGLLGYILSRPSDWSIHTWQLANIYIGDSRGNGIEAIKSMITELRNHGYVVYNKYRNSNGHWEHRYDVYPMPIADFQKMFPEMVKPPLDEPPLDKAPILTSTELPSTELDCSVSVAEPSPVAQPPSGNTPISCKLNTFSGEPITVSKSSLYEMSVLRDVGWSSEEIDQLYEVLAKKTDPVRDLFLFCDGIVKNIRNSVKRSKLSTKKKQKCQEIPSLKKQQSKEKSENSSKTTSGKDTLDPRLQNWRQTLWSLKNSSNTCTNPTESCSYMESQDVEKHT